MALLRSTCGGYEVHDPTLRKERNAWGTRHRDFNVYMRDKVVETLKYMHRNAVKGGLVERPEDWRWSSTRYYLLGEKGMVEVDRGWM